MDKIYLKLGPKAGNGQFWDPITETQVSKGEVVPFEGRQSWLIKGAIEGGHLMLVTPEELAKVKPISKMNKVELVEFMTPKLDKEELALFTELTKAKMCNITIAYETFEATLSSIPEFTKDELEEEASSILDEEDLIDFNASKEKANTLVALLPSYFNPFDL